MNFDPKTILDSDEKFSRVEEWVKEHAQDPFPHYNVEYSSDEDVSVEEEQPFTPRMFRESLKRCQVCLKPGSTIQTLQCIKAHSKYFCVFCFELLDDSTEAVAEHNAKMKHFFSEKDFLVSCPFRNCPQSQCLTNHFYYYQAIQLHVMNAHVPLLDSIVAMTEAVLEDGKDNNCDSSGYGSGRCGRYGSGATVQTAVHDTSMKQLVSLVGNKKIPKLRKPKPNTNNKTLKEISNRTIKKPPSKQKKRDGRIVSRGVLMTSSSESSESEASSSTSPGIHFQPKPTELVHVQENRERSYFACPLCAKKFKYRLGFQHHHDRQTCSFMDGKLCSNCLCSFSKFTILNTILHLQECKPSS